MIFISKEDNAKKTIRELIEDEIDCEQEWELVDDSFDHEFGTEKVIYINYTGPDEIVVEFSMNVDPRKDHDLMDFIENPGGFQSEVEIEYYIEEAIAYLSLLDIEVVPTIDEFLVTLTYSIQAEVQ